MRRARRSAGARTRAMPTPAIIEATATRDETLSWAMPDRP